MENEVTYEIIWHLADLETPSDGMQLELNIVSWNNAAPVFDIRRWNEDHSKLTKGVTLTKKQMEKLCFAVDPAILSGDLAKRCCLERAILITEDVQAAKRGWNYDR